MAGFLRRRLVFAGELDSGGLLLRVGAQLEEFLQAGRRCCCCGCGAPNGLAPEPCAGGGAPPNGSAGCGGAERGPNGSFAGACGACGCGAAPNGSGAPCASAAPAASGARLAAISRARQMRIVNPRSARRHPATGSAPYIKPRNASGRRQTPRRCASNRLNRCCFRRIPTYGTLRFPHAPAFRRCAVVRRRDLALAREQANYLITCCAWNAAHRSSSSTAGMGNGARASAPPAA